MIDYRQRVLNTIPTHLALPTTSHAAALRQLDWTEGLAAEMMKQRDDLAMRVSFLSNLCIRGVVEGWTETQMIEALTKP